MPIANTVEATIVANFEDRLTGPSQKAFEQFKRNAESAFRAVSASGQAAFARIKTAQQAALNLKGRNFEMGWNHGGKVIPFKTINSAHFVIFIVPFLVALIMRLARERDKMGLPTLKALCIEAESLTPENLAALLKGLKQMKQKGVLDNVLVAHYHSLRDTDQLSGFQEHILGETESQAEAIAL